MKMIKCLKERKKQTNKQTKHDGNEKNSESISL